MLSGADIRRYRKTIGLSQSDLASQIGLAQSTLSQIEGGQIPLSSDHIRLISEKLGESKHSPTFEEFTRDIESGEAEGLAALAAPSERHSTLTVWALEPGFDLRRTPPPEQAVDLVTVRAGEKSAIALRMGKATKWWTEGEIFVFETCGLHELQDGSICVAHVHGARRGSGKTLVGVARVKRTKRGKSIQFEPVAPSGAIFAVDEEKTSVVLQAIYRVQRLK